MDDRSRFMVLLQEKNKRLERLKRTQATGGTGSLSLSGTSSIRTAIQEGNETPYAGLRSLFMLLNECIYRQHEINIVINDGCLTHLLEVITTCMLSGAPINNTKKIKSLIFHKKLCVRVYNLLMWVCLVSQLMWLGALD